MLKIIMLFAIFMKIGAFSFGGGYAMLPFIQTEFIDKYKIITQNEFLDLLAISQSSPGPVAINSATFVGYKVDGIIGSVSATIGVVLFSFIGLIIVSRLHTKFKENIYVINFLTTIRPITVGFILSAIYSSACGITVDFYFVVSFISSLWLLFSKRMGSIKIVFLFGIIGIILKL